MCRLRDADTDATRWTLLVGAVSFRNRVPPVGEHGAAGMSTYQKRLGMNTYQRCLQLQRKSYGVNSRRSYENPLSGNECSARRPNFRQSCVDAKRIRNASSPIDGRCRSKHGRAFQRLLTADQYRRFGKAVAESDRHDLGQLPPVVDAGTVQTAVRTEPLGCGQGEIPAAIRGLYGRRSKRRTWK